VNAGVAWQKVIQNQKKTRIWVVNIRGGARQPSEKDRTIVIVKRIEKVGMYGQRTTT